MQQAAWRRRRVHQATIRITQRRTNPKERRRRREDRLACLRAAPLIGMQQCNIVQRDMVLWNICAGLRWDWDAPGEDATCDLTYMQSGGGYNIILFI